MFLLFYIELKRKQQTSNSETVIKTDVEFVYRHPGTKSRKVNLKKTTPEKWRARPEIKKKRGIRNGKRCR